MTKSSAIKQLDTVIGKLSNINYHIEGNKLQDAIRAVAYTRDLLQSGQIKTKKA